MNSLEILQALKRLCCNHVGVYAADRLPRAWTRSTAIVANTDEHDKPGTHWVAFYIDEHGAGTYFDSYGLPPHTDQRFLMRLRRNSVTYRWNTVQLQGLFSQTCGHYCCVFLYYQSRGYNLEQFLQLFSDDYNFNDKIIVRLYHKIFSRNRNKFTKHCTSCCSVQSCTFKKNFK